MANWKELGEVPDSDDELDYDSQESEGLPNADLPVNGPDKVLQPMHDAPESVWDVPDSSQGPPVGAPANPRAAASNQEEGRPSADEPASSPLSSAQDLDELADMFELESEAATVPLTTRPMHFPDGRDESPDPLMGDDSISTSYVKITAPQPQFPFENDVRSLSPPAAEEPSEPRSTPRSSPRSPTRGSPRSPPRSPPGNQPGSQPRTQPRPSARQRRASLSQDEEVAIQAALRYERSLRPRKPIQEHPYLIENAQYNKVFKSHGLRPIRMPTEPPLRRNRAEDDSQEKDFEASQGSTADAPNETIHESQFNGLEEPSNSRLSLSPSSLRTSSPKHKGGPSSQPSQDRETDNTSLSGNEELPSIEEIFRKSTTTRSAKKRRRVGTAISKPRPSKQVVPDAQSPSRPTFQQYDDVYGLMSSSPPSPQIPPANFGPLADSEALMEMDDVRLSGDEEDQAVDDGASPSLERHRSDTADPFIDITMADAPDAEDAGDNIDSLLGDLGAISEPESEDGPESGSESGSEIVKNVGRRIRGVLPASWLRLDQQTNRPKPTQQQHHEPSPEKTPRRGVAIRRIGRSASTTAASFIFEDSDDEVTPMPKPAPDIHDADIRTSFQRVRAPVIELDDGDSSAMEDNEIDHMAPSRKRQLTLNESFQQPAKRQKKHASTSGAQPRKRGRPPKAAGRSKGLSRLDPWVTTQKQTSSGHRSADRVKTPPRLSILDVIEPDAPRFLKIAARTAQNRRHLGRSSPTKKTIRLATRKDNVDAGTVLQKWKGGKIRPRQGLRRSSGRSKPASRNPLTPLPSNVFSRAAAASPKSQTATQPVRSHHGDAGTPSPSTRRTPRPFSRHNSTGTPRAQDVAPRPAQLETDLSGQTGRIAFHARKRALDALFRRSRSQSLSVRSTHLDSIMDDACSVASERSPAPRGSPEPPVVEKPRRKRQRKPAQPTHVDVAAARFRHADDPLPTTELVTPAETPKTAKFDENQLLGLGPFGTQYTQHFEIFPLDRGVFFHETTLMGSGRVESAVDEHFTAKFWQPRCRVTFHLGEQALRWDIWAEQVSSEFGILMDGILDQIFKPTASAEPGFNTRDAALFVLDYVQKAMSFTDDAGARSFVTRLLDVTRSFLSRLDSESHLDAEKRLQLVDVLSSLLLVIYHATRLCQNHIPLVSESFTVEAILRKTAEALVRTLLEIGLDDVVHLYDDLQTLRYRERGIRSDRAIPHAWVLLMKVLESLQIPRMAFWDVAYSRLIQPAIIRGADAQAFERLWKAMFTLMPLCEFDNMGVVVAERRHRLPMEGWALPQQVLKRVFQLYRDNPRQSPSFNDYCRTLVSRCYYLVDQWGWQKCGGVIGTIFDFFGSQNLSHLRNEEAFRSARFLDNLHRKPSLRVDPEDRCFHIFLKLVALAIKKLREKGLVKDIRNLVARTLPNHDRQYSKEQNVHQTDLAALRNHHDLLCTLFWAAPADLRPGIHNLEKLVIPASSHKEACLINLRAWNQLARYVAHEESSISFLPLAKWQTNVFKQLLDQYNSVAADIQQQFLAMSKDASSGISEDLIKSIVANNKAATMEIMLFSVKSSMDVVQHASSLELARLASNSLQLQEVFQHFSTLPADFPSALLQASLANFERLVGRIGSVFDEGYDSQDSMASKTVESEDAILMLERELAAVFFSMARCILSNQAVGGKPGVKTVSSVCVEQCVVVSGTVASLFVRCEMMRLSQVFKRGKYGLFENVPTKLSWNQRPYLPLFLATVTQKGAEINLADLGIDILQLWLLVIVQPSHCLRFENQFGLQLQNQGYPFVPEKAKGLVANPGYLSNRNFFEHAMKWMRQSLQTTNAATKKELNAEFSRALNNVMHQMRTDLQVMAAESSEHPLYVRFVRNIISLITAYGADITAVHKFFKEVSKEYSPPLEDPQLQVAVIQSYALRLAEGDSGPVNSLFFLFLNNFKQALLRGRLPQEVLLLKEAMKSDSIVAFTVRMLSAVLHASLSCQEVYALLDVLCDALGLVLKGPAVARQLNDDSLASMSGLVTAILAWATAVKGMPICAEHIHVLRKMLWLLNAFQPALESFSFASGEVSWWDEVMERLDWLAILVKGAQEHLETELVQSDTPSLSPSALFGRLRGTNQDFRIQDANVLNWSVNIVTDVQRNWLVTGPILTVSRNSHDASSTQTAHGSMKPNWNVQELVASLYDQLRIWDQWWTTVKEVPDEREALGNEEDMIF